MKASFYTKTFVLYLILFFTSLLLFFWPDWDRWDFILEPSLIFGQVIIYLLWLNQLIKDRQKSKLFTFSAFIFAFALGTTLYGAGMHFAANKIRGVLGGGPHSITYFYDEILSHWISYSSVLTVGLSFVLLNLSSAYRSNSSKADVLLAKAIGVVGGVVVSLQILEANSGSIGLTFSVLFAIIAFIGLRKKEENKYPLAIFYLYLFIAMSFGILIWLAKFNGLPEPSAIGFGRF